MINLTQHNTSSEQIEAGVIDMPAREQELLKGMLTFHSPPLQRTIHNRAIRIAKLAEQSGHDKAMIGGAPFLMSALEYELRCVGVEPFYAFTKRVVEEKDGVKKSVFKHEGFTPAYRHPAMDKSIRENLEYRYEREADAKAFQEGDQP